MAHRRLKRLILIALMAGLAVSAFPARVAAGTLDQSQANLGAGSLGFGNAFGSVYEAGQSFTAGLSGTLDQVDVDVSRSSGCDPGSGISLAIRTVTDAMPTDTTLASANLPASTISFINSWVSLSFAAPTEVTEGSQYALVLSAPDASCSEDAPYWLAMAGDDPYPRGQAMANGPSGWGTGAVEGFDLAFKTYVAPAVPGGPPPPPSSATPSNAISLGKAVLNNKKGTATVPVFVPGAGVVTLRGRGVIKQRREKASAGIVNMLVKPADKTKRKLNATGKAKVGIAITYTPTGGSSSSKSKSLVLKKLLH
jgi:hypothetical protein